VGKNVFKKVKLLTVGKLLELGNSLIFVKI